jgi:uncharacterized damage-inducible protein DinB
MSNAVLASLFSHKAWCNQGLLAALRAAPADADRRQMAVIVFTFDHTSIVDRIFKARLAGEPHGFESVVATSWPNLDALAKTMAETDAWYLDYVRTASTADLESVVEFTFVADGQEGRMTKAEILAHVITHGASHRGAIGAMLERLSVRGAMDMMTSFSSESRRAAATVG